MQTADADAIADEAVSLLGTGRQVRPYSQRFANFDLATAYGIGERIRAKREAQGERVAGRKIGFTNRGIWGTYGVSGPIWSYMYDASVRELRSGAAVDPRRLPEPLIEPEIAFRFAAAPRAGMSNMELLRTIQWVAHGFEIVVSIFPGWKFAAADTIVGYGMHHTLLLGAAVVIDGDHESWAKALAGFTVELDNQAGVLKRGQARDVLSGPLDAVRFLLEEIARFGSPPVAAGEIVTTGTLTEAMPIAPGDTWTTRLTGIPLAGLEMGFA